ncbi:hypothetical protein A6R68_17616, partial [Neotoma lepida]
NDSENFHLNSDEEQCVKCSESQYANIQQNHCLQKAVTFLTCEDSLRMALTCVSLGFSVFYCLYSWCLWKAPQCSHCQGHLYPTSKCIWSFVHGGSFHCLDQKSYCSSHFQATVQGRMVRWRMISGTPNFIIPICTLIQLLCGICLSIYSHSLHNELHT